MISFENDYSEGCHEKILEAFVCTNMQQEVGYGDDSFSKSAKEKIRDVIGCPQADIYFVNGGTQANQLVIDTMLQPYEGVVAAQTGHVNAHEAGAIEFSGHKVLTVPSHAGKVDAREVADFVERFYGDASHEHMVFPGMLYISHPTEYGTLYTQQELKDLALVCHEHKMTLFLDGARLGYGLMANGTDVTWKTLSRLCDVFYIGGTKMGALNGEAIVFTKNNTPAHFVTRIKQHGALSAKGRMFGVQFDTLFTDGLYEQLGRHAILMAERLKEILRACGLPFYIDSPTNQQFVILEDDKMEQLSKQVRFSFWEKYDETHTVVRFATSWATKSENLDALELLLNQIYGKAPAGAMIDNAAASRAPKQAAETSDLAARYQAMLEEEQRGRMMPGSILIKDTTKSQRIEVIKSWIPADETNDECNMDLWEIYADYINGTREIAEINAGFQAGYVI